jgi:hypothetical protein
MRGQGRPTGTGLGVFSPPLLVPAGSHLWGQWTQWPCCAPRLMPLHQVLQPMASCARVIQCAEAVPTLLQAFFSAVTQVSPLPHGTGRGGWGT